MDVFSRRSLLNAIVRLQDRKEGEKVCWRHANGRTFEITPDNQEPDKVRVIENEPRLYDFICLNRIWWDDPNGYEKAYRSWSCLPYQEPSIRDKSLFKCRFRLRIISLSVEDAIDSVSDAIDQNRVYRPIITPFVLNYKDLLVQVKQENMQRIRNYNEYYIKQKKVENLYEQSMGADIPYFFRGFRNEDGPICEDGRNCLLSFFNSPSIDTWDKVADLIISYDIINHNRTAWEIWISLDPSAPRSLNEDGDWPKIPDEEMFIRILETARSAPTRARMPKIFPLVTIDSVLNSKVIQENAIRRDLEMTELTDAEVNEAFSRSAGGGGVAFSGSFQLGNSQYTR